MCIWHPFALQNFLTKSEIQSLVAGGDNEELKKRLCDRMEFGTAGELRHL